ncbi:MAG: SDR family oxidoreductase [Chloroflexi bacterium]|nr:SDR family oxidoreductase [Chloroflexota bacterium]
MVNIASLAGKQAIPMGGPYSISKFAVIGLTQTMALELGKFGITVNAVCPGWTDTDRLEANASLIANQKSREAAEAEKKKRDEEWIAKNPMRRVTTPEDIANAVVFLASDDASDINGQSLNVCGGVLLS